MQVARNHYKEMDGIPETPDNSDVKTKMKKKTKLLWKKEWIPIRQLATPQKIHKDAHSKIRFTTRSGRNEQFKVVKSLIPHVSDESANL